MKRFTKMFGIFAVCTIAVLSLIQLNTQPAYANIPICVEYCGCFDAVSCPNPSGGGDYCRKPPQHLESEACKYWNGSGYTQTTCINYCCTVLICAH